MPIRDRLTTVGLVVAAILAAPPSLIAQQRDVRDLSGFHSVSIGGGLDLYVKRGDTFVVEVDGNDDPSKIITEVRDGTLEVRRDGKWTDFFGAGDEGEVYVTMPTLEALSASGGSDVSVEGTFSGDALRVAASGGSDVTYTGNPATVNVESSGGGDVTRR